MTIAIQTLSVKDATGTTQNLPVRPDSSGYDTPIHTSDLSIAHFRGGTIDFAPVASANEVAILAGNASTDVRLKRLVIGGAATAAGSAICKVVKCSTAGSAGSAVLTTVASVPLDANNAAASSFIGFVSSANYTTAPTAIGIVAAGRIQLAAIGSVTTSGAAPALEFKFGDNAQALVLRGTSQCLAIHLNGVSVPSGGKLDIFAEWAETTVNEA